MGLAIAAERRSSASSWCSKNEGADPGAVGGRDGLLLTAVGLRYTPAELAAGAVHLASLLLGVANSLPSANGAFWRAAAPRNPKGPARLAAWAACRARYAAALSTGCGRLAQVGCGGHRLGGD